MKKLNYVSLITIAAVSFASCAKSPAPVAASPATLPASFYHLPENGAPVAAEVNEEKLGQMLDQTISAQADALDEATTQSFDMEGLNMNSLMAKPKDYTPWHMAAFMTDFSVGLQGILGSLIMKGSPAVTLVWRKKEAAKPAVLTAMPETNAGEVAPVSEVIMTDESTEATMDRQLDEAVAATLADGKVTKDKEPVLRNNLRGALHEFRSLTQGLDDAAGHDWWVSRLRLDVSVEASAKVHYLAFASVGGDVRLRFEWHRIKSKKPRAVTAGPAKPIAFANSFHGLINAIASDLPALTAGSNKELTGFQPASFRVGLGVTAGGSFGIAKGSGTVIGHVYFSNNTPKPKMQGLVAAESESELESSPVAEAGTITMIESGASAEHMSFAKENNVPYEKLDGALEKVAYKVDRAQFRKGLFRAGRMSNFFARRAKRKVQAGHWGIYELKTGLDFSMTGVLPMVKIGGIATTEIAFFNENF